MKVCVLSGYPPGIGRGSEQVFELVEELKKCNEVNITILANKVMGSPQFESKEGLTIKRIWRPGNWASAVRVIVEVMRIKPQILHIHHPHLYYGGAFFTATFILSLLSLTRLRGIKNLVWWEHVYPPESITGTTMKTYRYRSWPAFLKIGLKFYTTMVGRLTKRVLVQTDTDMRVIKDHYKVNNAARLVIGKAGQKQDKEQARAKLNLPTAKKVLLIFGFISPFKGIEYAIAALPRVQSLFPDTILLIAGGLHPRLKDSDNYLKMLKEAIRDNPSAKDIILLDSYIPSNEHSLYFSSADAVLLPYVSSLGPSSVGMEAFLHDIPVIASRLDFIRDDIEDGVTGLLVQPADSAALSGAIIRLLGDEVLRKRIIDNTRVNANRYNIQEVVGQLRLVYQQL